MGLEEAKFWICYCSVPNSIGVGPECGEVATEGGVGRIPLRKALA